jgi:hypothetical protein
MSGKAHTVAPASLKHQGKATAEDKEGNLSATDVSDLNSDSSTLASTPQQSPKKLSIIAKCFRSVSNSTQCYTLLWLTKAMYEIMYYSPAKKSLKKMQLKKEKSKHWNYPARPAAQNH